MKRARIRKARSSNSATSNMNRADGRYSRALNVAIERGEILVLLGRSGLGKTTALKLVNRLLTLSRGEILVDGRDTKDWDVIKLRRHIGYAIQDVGLFPHYTVERNIGLILSLERWDKEKIHARVQELLRLAGLNPDLRRGIPINYPEGNASGSAWPARLAADPADSADGRAFRRTRSADPCRSAARIFVTAKKIAKDRFSSSPMIFMKHCAWEAGSRCSKPASWSRWDRQKNF